MTAELIEREAEWLYNHDDSRNLFVDWEDALETGRTHWRNKALANFKMLNECGVRMPDPKYNVVGAVLQVESADADMPSMNITVIGEGFVRVQPLPEKE